MPPSRRAQGQHAEALVSPHPPRPGACRGSAPRGHEWPGTFHGGEGCRRGAPACGRGPVPGLACPRRAAQAAFRALRGHVPGGAPPPPALHPPPPPLQPRVQDSRGPPARCPRVASGQEMNEAPLGNLLSAPSSSCRARLPGPVTHPPASAAGRGAAAPRLCARWNRGRSPTPRASLHPCARTPGGGRRSTRAFPRRFSADPKLGFWGGAGRGPSGGLPPPIRTPPSWAASELSHG